MHSIAARHAALQQESIAARHAALQQESASHSCAE
jgi:hypothetical protein